MRQLQGTRGAFEELLDVKDQCKYAQELDSTGAVLAKVCSTPGAIGYVSLDVLDDTVTAMKIDGVEATEEKHCSRQISSFSSICNGYKGQD